MRIMLSGPSGIGKTTFMDIIGRDFDLEKYSGSMSDLISSTKELSHKDMLSRDSEVLYKEDYQLLNLRNKLFKDKATYITDRSYLDSAAYFLYKQASKVPQCEIDHFFELCKMLLNQQCDLLILFDFPKYMIKDWVMEDNNKRIINKYFQHIIAEMMKDVLNIWGCHLEHQNVFQPNFWNTAKTYEQGFSLGKISSIYGVTNVLVLHEAKFETRQEIINNYLSGKLCQKL